MAISFNCLDFLGFQESLRRMRDLDDKIIYALNSLPTESFKGQVNSDSTCKELYEQLQKIHEARGEAIRNCITMSAESLIALRDRREADPGDSEIDRKFKTEQRKLRVLQSELNVEDIVKDRSYKAFNERCKTYFHGGKNTGML